MTAKRRLASGRTLLLDVVATPSMGLVEFLIIAGLVFVNGFFVAAEFALVKVRTSQIDQLVEQGNWAAKLTSRALDRLDAYLSASQVGITVASLALGWAIEGWVEPASRRCSKRSGSHGGQLVVGHGLSVSVVPVARVHARHVPPRGAGRAGPQEPGDPLGEDRRALDGARPDGDLLHLLAGDLAAQQRQQPHALGCSAWARPTTPSWPTPKKSCGTSSPRASPAATSRGASG